MSTGIEQAITTLAALSGDDIDSEIRTTEQRLSALRALRASVKAAEANGRKRKGPNAGTGRKSRKSPVEGPTGTEQTS